MTKKTNFSKTIVFLMVFLLLLIIIINYSWWKYNYYHHVFSDIYIGNINLEKLDYTKAQNIISQKTKQITKKGLLFKYKDKEIIIPATISSFDSDLSTSILYFNVEETAKQAFIKQSFIDYLKHFLIDKQNQNIKAVYNLNTNKIKEVLSQQFSELNIPSHNAYFSISPSNSNELIINPERIGKEINYSYLFSELENNLDNLENKPVIIRTRTTYPKVKAKDLLPLEKEVKKYLKIKNIILNYDNKSWLIETKTIITWFSVENNNSHLTLKLNANKVKKYLEKNIVPKINKKPIRPKFEIKNNKVTNWIIGKEGREVNLDKTFQEIENNLLHNNNIINIIVDPITNDNYIPEAGFTIKEIIGTGSSNFRGSPSNRRHNIRLGASSVNGSLIKPGAEFSLVKTLGEIDKESGYLPELVIKDNKTVPEYGGGLCQIGTTLFRAALASGLPITERRNHSYRVSYYEPAGTDATIYDPKPDLRFVNDTNHYILIQSRIEGNNLYFDFWGTKDGRIISTTTPVISNIKKPEPTKLIETTELPLGKKKCTEHAHNGADAYFDYKVIYPESASTTPKIKETRFISHYMPWQEVCLIGIEASSTTTSTIEEIKKEE